MDQDFLVIKYTQKTYGYLTGRVADPDPDDLVGSVSGFKNKVGSGSGLFFEGWVWIYFFLLKRRIRSRGKPTRICNPVHLYGIVRIHSPGVECMEFLIRFQLQLKKTRGEERNSISEQWLDRAALLVNSGGIEPLC